MSTKSQKPLNLFIFLILLGASFLLCFDFLKSSGRLVTFDGMTHMSNIAQYYNALKDGDFPVRWLGSSANYGMPFGIFSQQTVAYLGALLMFVIGNTLITYNVIIFLFAFIGCLTLYVFLREYVDKVSALAGTILFCFAPYRIINIYVRGAIPEFVASIFLPLILLSLKKWIVDKKTNYYFLLIASLALLFLTHPISAIVFSVIAGLYFVFLIWGQKDWKRAVLFTIGAIVLSLGISSFYLLPLTREFSYLNQGTHETIFTSNSFIGINNLFREGLTGNNYLHIGLIELVVFVLGLVLVLRGYIRKKKIKPLLIISFISLLIYGFLITKAATPLFYLVKPLGNVQHQWRFLSGIIFVAPLILAFTLNNIFKRYKFIATILLVISLVITRFPWVKGENYVVTPESNYFSSKENLYAQVMNTLWTGLTESYPVKEVKGEVIEGKGEIVGRNEHNSWRKYEINSDGKIRMVDNTFYFPGWKVYIDGKDTPIEFQDVNYKGVITYKVPSGRHTVLVRFENTKTRRFANTLTSVSLVVFGGLFFFRFYYLKR